MPRIFALIIILIVSACTNVENLKKIDAAQNANVGAFNAALAREYQDYADVLSSKWHFVDAKYFKQKSQKALTGESTAPEDISKLQLPENHQADLQWANSRFENVAIESVKNDYPSRLARVQMLKDCWVLGASHGYKKEDVEECRMDFVLEIGMLEGALMPSVIIAPIDSLQKTSVNREDIYFALNSSEIDASSMQTIEKIINVLKETDGYILRINGYRDSAEKNKDLPTKRAKVVSENFINRGINKNIIEENMVENIKPATIENVKEEDKKRVEIYIENIN